MQTNMSMSARILPAFDQVIEGTRQHLESIPDDRLTWKPHDKSYTLAGLGTHLANLPTWAMITIGQDEFDVAPPGEDTPWLDPFDSSDVMVRTIDENATAARSAIEGASDDDLMAEWTLLKSGEALFTLPKIAVLRTFVMDHMIHHRGQLTVYLRLLDVPVKPTFGPTADFPDF